MHLLTIAKYTCLEALRNRLLWLALACCGGALACGLFLGDLLILEQRDSSAVLCAALLRPGLLFIIMLWVITSGIREQDDRALHLLLALPMSRSQYLFGKLAGFAVLTLGLSALAGLTLLLIVPSLATLAWSLSLWCESLLVTALSLLLLLSFRNATIAIACGVLFYLVARLMGAMLLMATQPTFPASSTADTLLRLGVEGLALLLPALYRFTSAAWLVQGSPALGELLAIVAQGLVYVGLLSAMALFDLYRKRL